MKQVTRRKFTSLAAGVVSFSFIDGFDPFGWLTSHEEPVTYEPGHTQWENGLDGEEIHRFNVDSKQSFLLKRVELQLKGGGKRGSLELEVYDEEYGTIIESATAGDPLLLNDPAEINSNTVLIRLSNSSGEELVASPIVRGEISQ